MLQQLAAGTLPTGADIQASILRACEDGLSLAGLECQFAGIDPAVVRTMAVSRGRPGCRRTPAHAVAAAYGPRLPAMHVFIRGGRYRHDPVGVQVLPACERPDKPGALNPSSAVGQSRLSAAAIPQCAAGLTGVLVSLIRDLRVRTCLAGSGVERQARGAGARRAGAARYKR